MRTSKTGNKGFSLIELLIVIAIILIIMAVAIPSFIKKQAQGNELSAIQSIKAINDAEVQYQMYYPQVGYTCNLSVLGKGGAGNTQTSGPGAAGLIDDTSLLNGTKAGYTFTITNCNGASAGNTTGTGSTNAVVTSYQVNATPVTPGKSGTRYFCSDSPSSVHYSISPNCNPNSDPTI